MIDYGHGVTFDIIRCDDLETIRQWRNSPKIYRWCRQNSLIYPEDQKKWYEWQRKDPTTKMFSVYKNEIIVGVAGLTSIDLVNSRAEFSLYIAPDHQGKGLSKPALKTLFSYGFMSLGLRSIWGETFEDNPAQYIFLNIGMKKEGIRRQFYFKDGRYCDAILFSILNDEYEDKWTHSLKGY